MSSYQEASDCPILLGLSSVVRGALVSPERQTSLYAKPWTLDDFSGGQKWPNMPTSFRGPNPAFNTTKQEASRCADPLAYRWALKSYSPDAFNLVDNNDCHLIQPKVDKVTDDCPRIGPEDMHSMINTDALGSVDLECRWPSKESPNDIKPSDLEDCHRGQERPKHVGSKQTKKNTDSKTYSDSSDSSDCKYSDDPAPQKLGNLYTNLRPSLETHSTSSCSSMDYRLPRSENQSSLIASGAIGNTDLNVESNRPSMDRPIDMKLSGLGDYSGAQFFFKTPTLFCRPNPAPAYVSSKQEASRCTDPLALRPYSPDDFQFVDNKDYRLVKPEVDKVATESNCPRIGPEDLRSMINTGALGNFDLGCRWPSKRRTIDIKPSDLEDSNGRQQRPNTRRHSDFTRSKLKTDFNIVLDSSDSSDCKSSNLMYYNNLVPKKLGNLYSQPPPSLQTHSTGACCDEDVSRIDSVDTRSSVESARVPLHSRTNVTYVPEDEYSGFTVNNRYDVLSSPITIATKSENNVTKDAGNASFRSMSGNLGTREYQCQKCGTRNDCKCFSSLKLHMKDSVKSAQGTTDVNEPRSKVRSSSSVVVLSDNESKRSVRLILCISQSKVEEPCDDVVAKVSGCGRDISIDLDKISSRCSSVSSVHTLTTDESFNELSDDEQVDLDAVARDHMNTPLSIQPALEVAARDHIVKPRSIQPSLEVLARDHIIEPRSIQDWLQGVAQDQIDVPVSVENGLEELGEVAGNQIVPILPACAKVNGVIGDNLDHLQGILPGPSSSLSYVTPTCDSHSDEKNDNKDQSFSRCSTTVKAKSDKKIGDVCPLPSDTKIILRYCPCLQATLMKDRYFDDRMSGVSCLDVGSSQEKPISKNNGTNVLYTIATRFHSRKKRNPRSNKKTAPTTASSPQRSSDTESESVSSDSSENSETALKVEYTKKNTKAAVLTDPLVENLTINNPQRVVESDLAALLQSGTVSTDFKTVVVNKESDKIKYLSELMASKNTAFTADIPQRLVCSREPILASDVPAFRPRRVSSPLRMVYRNRPQRSHLSNWYGEIASSESKLSPTKHFRPIGLSCSWGNVRTEEDNEVTALFPQDRLDPFKSVRNRLSLNEVESQLEPQLYDILLQQSLFLTSNRQQRGCSKSVQTENTLSQFPQPSEEYARCTNNVENFNVTSNIPVIPISSVAEQNNSVSVGERTLTYSSYPDDGSSGIQPLSKLSWGSWDDCSFEHHICCDVKRQYRRIYYSEDSCSFYERFCFKLTYLDADCSWFELLKFLENAEHECCGLKCPAGECEKYCLNISNNAVLLDLLIACWKSETSTRDPSDSNVDHEDASLLDTSLSKQEYLDDSPRTPTSRNTNRLDHSPAVQSVSDGYYVYCLYQLFVMHYNQLDWCFALQSLGLVLTCSVA